MPPSSKRQKIDNALDISRPGAQRGIRAFGTISKPLSNRHEPGKNKLDGSRKVADQGSGNTFPLIGVNCLKRKREESLPEHSPIEEEDLGDGDCGLSLQAEPQDGRQEGNTADKKPLSTVPLQLAPKQQPSNVREKARTPSHHNHVSTQSGRACLESLPLEPTSSSDLNIISLLSSSEALETPHPSLLPTKGLIDPHSINNTPKDPHELPDELQDQVDSYSSFLTALSLHYAHNGWPTPADLRVLRPSIERSWRRRRVSTDDVRRILGIAQGFSADSDQGEEQTARRNDLSLVDYGRGKICIETSANLQSQGFFQKRPLDEEALNRRFIKNLMRQWKTYQETCENTTTAAAGAFISQLPLASITICPSILKISPLLAKGQRRLEDLKAGAIRAQQKNYSKPNTSNRNGSLTPLKNPSAAAAAAPTTRNSSLLSRIRAKQSTALSSLPETETHQANILRKSALQRLQEIIPVLEILTTTTTTSASTSHCCNSSSSSSSDERQPLLLQTRLSSGTHSYTMPAIVQHLQTSLRNPIAKDDAVRCVRLLASEVAPEWVGVREVGRVVGVTVRKGGWGRGMVGGGVAGEGGGMVGKEGGRGDVMRRVEELLVGC